MARTLKIIALWLGLCSTALFATSAAFADCPPHSSPFATTDNGKVIKTTCRCDSGYLRQGNMCAVVAKTVPNLAPDNTAACLAASALRILDHRLDGIRKSIALLSDNNPEWAKERDRLLEDMHENRRGIAIDTANVVSIGTLAWAKAAAKIRVEDLKRTADALRAPLEALPAEADRVNSIMRLTTDPKLIAAMRGYAQAAQRLAAGRQGEQVIELAQRTHDVAEAAHTEYEIMKAHPQPMKFADALYWSSALVGAVAIAFVTVPAEVGAAAGGSVVASMGTAALQSRNLWQEYDQLGRLGQEASARNAMKMELQARLSDLLDQRERAAGVVQRSGPAANCRQ